MTKERYPQEIIEQVRNSIYLPDVVQRYTTLNKYGKGLCLFHTERHPSFSVNANKGLWHCFGCGKGGDVFKFIMEAEKVTFPNAVKLLAFEVGIRLPESDSIKQILREKWKEKKEKMGRLDYLEGLLKEYERAIFEYIKIRIGYLPLRVERTARDYTEELLLEQDFDELDAVIEKRKELFEGERRRIRVGE